MNRIPLAAAVLAIAVLVAPAQSAMAAPVHTAAVKYSNCTKLHRKYPHGVGKSGAHDHVSSGKPVTNFKVSTTVYNANKSLDRDKDHVACEAH